MAIQGTDWFYVFAEERRGPYDAAYFQALADEGIVREDTLVWNPSLAGWIPWREVDAAPSGPPALTEACVECGEDTLLSHGVRIGEVFVCAGCKPLYVLRLGQGWVQAKRQRYGTVAARAGAKLLDGLLLGMLNAGIQKGVLAAGVGEGALMVVSTLGGLAFSCGYSTFLVGRYGATLGKMALGLRIVRPDGARVGYGRAFVRPLAEMISGLLLYVGYFMAAFDGERRALHDRMCDTRVISE